MIVAQLAPAKRKFCEPLRGIDRLPALDIGFGFFRRFRHQRVELLGLGQLRDLLVRVMQRSIIVLVLVLLQADLSHLRGFAPDIDHAVEVALRDF